ncbi:MAG: hypothetical protein FD144_5923, partial [Rhodospirillaceae bacterium]
KSKKSEQSASTADASVSGTLETSMTKLADSMVRFATDQKFQYAPPNHIPRFNASSRMDIHAWLASMKAHFKATRLSKEFWVEQTAAHFDSRLHKEVKEMPTKSWRDFTKAVIEAFRTGDVAAQAGEELRCARQRKFERCCDFMARIKRLVGKSYPSMRKKDKDRLIADYFVGGLHDERVRLQVSDHIPLERSEKVKLHQLETVASRAATALSMEFGSVLDDSVGVQYDTQPMRDPREWSVPGSSWPRAGEHREEPEVSRRTDPFAHGQSRHRHGRRHGHFMAAGLDGAEASQDMAPDVSLIDFNSNMSDACYAAAGGGGNAQGAQRGSSAGPGGYSRGRGHGPSRGGGRGSSSSGFVQKHDRECFNCRQVGHMFRECPAPLRPELRSAAQKPAPSQQGQPPRPPVQQQAAGQQQFARQAAPRVAAVAQTQQQQYQQQQQPYIPPPLRQNQQQQYARGRQGPPTAMLMEVDVGLREKLSQFCGASGASMLFWAPVRVGDFNINALMDTGAGRNFISPPLLAEVAPAMKLDAPRPETILAGDGEAMHVPASVVLDFQLAGHWLRHRFNVSPELPIGMLIGGEVLQAHKASLGCGEQRLVTLGQASCETCETLRRDRSAMFALRPAQAAPFLDLPIAGTRGPDGVQ